MPSNRPERNVDRSYIVKMFNYLYWSAARVANEYYRASIPFSIVDRDSQRAAEAPGYTSKGIYERTTPIVLVPKRQLKKLEFINDAIKIEYLRGNVVDIPARKNGNFNKEDYLNEWTNSIRECKIAAVIPERINDFSDNNRAVRLILAYPVQEFVIERKLDTALNDKLADIVNDNRVRIIIDFSAPDVIPPWWRLWSVDAEDLILRFKDEKQANQDVVQP